MKPLLTCFAALLLAGVSASVAQAQYPFPVRPLPYYCPVPPLSAPDMRSGGFYTPNNCGLVYGPGYCVTPPFPPFQGMLPIPGCANSPAAQRAFPSHPYVRSPRDFFMID